MHKEANLASDGLVGLFFYYFFPALIAMLSMSTHVIVDGFFVSHALGQDAVAALGVTWPIFPALVAFELLFAVGGASLISYHLGKAEAQRSREIFSSIVYFVVAIGAVISLILFIFTQEITRFLGATPVITDLANAYLEIIFLGSLFYFLHPILDLFIVNDKRPMLAMMSMIVASLANMILNYIFLFMLDFRIQASAFSTILGNVIAICILLPHFVRKKGDLFFVLFFSLKDVLHSAKNGIPASLSELSAGVVMLLYIQVLLTDLGEKGVVIYTVSMYGGVIFFTLLLSIAYGMQPIVSFNYGANQIQRVKVMYYLSLSFAVFVSLVVYALFYGFAKDFAAAFLDSKRVVLEVQEIIEQIASVIKVWFIAYIALAINMVSSIFLQAIQRPLGAMLITLCYSLIFTSILLPLLRHFFGEIGIWSAYPLSSVLTLVVVGAVLGYEFKKGALS